MLLWWTKRSLLPSSGVMKPKPFSSLNHLTVPVAMYSSTAFLRAASAVVATKRPFASACTAFAERFRPAELGARYHDTRARNHQLEDSVQAFDSRRGRQTASVPTSRQRLLLAPAAGPALAAPSLVTLALPRPLTQ